MSAPGASAVYSALLTHLERAHVLGTVNGLLSWDEQVNLPPGGAELRAAQSALLAELAHAAATAPELGTALRSLAPDPAAASASLSGEQMVVVRQARRDYDRATRLPPDFVRTQAEHSSRAYHVWTQCKARDDFAGFAPALERHVELCREEAALQGWADRPYDYFLDKYDPGATTEAVTRIFRELRAGLVPLGREVAARAAARPAVPVLTGFPAEQQRVFVREVAEKLGFDFTRGRLDASVHPFCSGTGLDTRITTRFLEEEPLSSVFGVIHEVGHGLYEQGLPAGHHATALGQHAGMGTHESQSRLWENQVGRSRGFWRHFEPRFRELFAARLAGISSDELYAAINQVAPTLIRIESDEVTYNLHIILRFELEQRLFAGTLAVRDLPEAWRSLSRELLGLEPPTDREGVLQDVHWSGGAFGYFPSYTLGNLFAAQLWYRALADLPGLEDDFARGEFSRLLGWLRTHVHSHGKRYDLLTLARTVTREELAPTALLRYLRERYLG